VRGGGWGGPGAPYKQVRKHMRISHPEMKMPINPD